ncbi:MAG TPA: hypothetical protein VJ979_13520 [Actinomycetota bacterium]|nr:hypothetical protein [Actinomycetota bacterium]
MASANRGGRARELTTRVLPVLIAVGALAVAATTGDSWAVRSILVLVAGDVAVRLWRA